MKKLVLRDVHAKAVAHCLFKGSVLEGTKEGVFENIHIDLMIESEEPVEKIQELARLTRRMCITEAALKPGTVIKQHYLNGQLVEV